MAKNDIIPFDDATYMPGTKQFKVKAGRTSAIKAGEFVLKALGNTAGYVVTAWTPGGAASAVKPLLTTNVLAGLAMSDSTETASAAGTVDVMPIVPGVTYLCSPNVAATWDTQSEYNALVGSRVVLDYSSAGVFTVLATDNAWNGLVVEPLDVIKHPGKVRFSLRQGLSYTA